MSKPKSFLSFLVLLATVCQAASFVPSSSRTRSGTSSCLAARPRRRNPNNSDESSCREGDEIPQLPAFRGYRAPTASSNNDSKKNSNAGATTSGEGAAFVNRKLELQYTCKVCDTRNHHKVSRIAYNKGVVIAVCKGCMNQHLISDHLGFTQKFDGNLEDYFAGQGSEESVARVNEDVFNLEKVLGVDTKGGYIYGPDGERHLE